MTPVGLRDDVVAELAQRDGGRDAAARSPSPAGRACRTPASFERRAERSAGRHERRVRVEPREERLEHARAALEDVDEVDAARPCSDRAALHLDERRDGMRRVRQQEVVVPTGRGRERMTTADERRAAASAPDERAGRERARLKTANLLQPAVDDERLAGDVARAVGGEEADDVAELARRAPAAAAGSPRAARRVGPPG